MKRELEIDIYCNREFSIEYGCSHGCRYCHEYYSALKDCRINTREEWSKPRAIIDIINLKPRELPGPITFPAKHDITVSNLQHAIPFLEAWLEANNRINITTKPSPFCINAICERFKKYRNRIRFEFSINSSSDGSCQFWEPFAPSYNDRLKALKTAWNCGYETSVAIEPLLDTTVFSIIRDTINFTTREIWIGKIYNSDIESDLGDVKHPQKKHYIELLKKANDEAFIRNLYILYKNNPKIRWRGPICELIELDAQR